MEKTKSKIEKDAVKKYTASTLLLAVAGGQLTPENAAKLLPGVCTRAYNYCRGSVLFRHAKWVGRGRKHATLANELLSAAESISREYAKKST